MKKRIVWLVVSVLMVLSLVLASCAPKVTEEKKVVTEEKKTVTEEKKAVTEEKKTVTEEKKAVTEGEFVEWTGTKLDGTSVRKTLEVPKYGGTLIRARESDPTTWDAAVRGGHIAWANGATNTVPTQPSYTRGPVGTEEWSGLISYTPPYSYTAGLLAETWEVPDDATIIYHIRKGVRWALDPTNEVSRLIGGRELTADDIVAFYRYQYSPTGYLGRSYPDILSDSKNRENSIYVSPDDPWAVVLKFKPGGAGTHFGGGGHHHGQVMAKEVIEKYAPVTDWKKVVGTGAFMLKDYIKGSSLTFEKNPSYFEHDPFFPKNQLPYVDSYKILIIPDVSTRLAAMRTGKIDLIYDIRAEDAEPLMKTNPEVKGKWYIGADPVIRMRNDYKPFDDIKVRQALRMAINYREMTDDFYVGKAALFSYPVSPNPDAKLSYIPLEKLSQSVQELYAYKPDKAKQLLTEAGYPTGFQTEALAWSEEQIDQLSIIKNYWAKIGVTLNIDVKEFTVYTTMTQGGTFTKMAMGTDSSQFYLNFLSLRPGQSSNPFLPGTTRALIDEPLGWPLYEEAGRRYWDTAKQEALMTTPLGEVFPDLPAAKGQPDYTTYINLRSWLVPLPNPYYYVLWQPWLKQSEGAFQQPGWNTEALNKYYWIDRDL
ncbi:MAG: ABC transporter substrate-binding protein, partial [Chloroflexi bacterium]|nr:ABC transporter substrate-binding protein [Chloroflexota bacterium]